MTAQPKQSSLDRPKSGAGKAILAYAPSRVIEPVLGLISLPILTRTLGVDEYGIFSIVFITATLMRTILFDWVSNCALRFRTAMLGAKDDFFTNLLLGTAFSFSMAAAIFLIIKGTAAPDSLKVVFAFFGWATADALFSSLAFTGEMVFRADQKPLLFALSRGFQGVSRHILGVGALVISGGDLNAYFLGRITGTLLTALWSWRLIHSFRHIRLGASSRDTQRKFFVFGFPIALSIFANALRTMGNRFAVIWLDGPEGAGLYSAAANIGGAPLMILQQVVMLGLYPLAINTWEKGHSISPITHDGLRYYFIVGTPAFAGMAMLSRPILSIVAGTKYEEAWPVLALFSLAMFIYALSQYFTLVLLVEKRTWLLAGFGIVAGIVNILFAVFLIPRYGYIAAAYSFLFSNILLMSALVLLNYASLKDSFPLKSFGKCALATVAMCAAIFLVTSIIPPSNLGVLLAVVLLSIAIFFLTLFLLGEIKNELAAVGKFMNRIFHRT